jgi:hypothetical protein
MDDLMIRIFAQQARIDALGEQVAQQADPEPDPEDARAQWLAERAQARERALDRIAAGGRNTHVPGGNFYPPKVAKRPRRDP